MLLETPRRTRTNAPFETEGGPGECRVTVSLTRMSRRGQRSALQTARARRPRRPKQWSTRRRRPTRGPGGAARSSARRLRPGDTRSPPIRGAHRIAETPWPSSRGREDSLGDEVVEARGAHDFRDERQDHESAVAVLESLTRLELRRMTAQHGEVVGRAASWRTGSGTS